MSASLNKVMIMGNLGANPDARSFADGGMATRISVATTDAWTDGATQQRTEKTEWHRIVFYRRLAEVAAEYLRKGSHVYVEGKLETRSFVPEGSSETKYVTEIRGLTLKMLDKRGAAPQSDDHDRGTSESPATGSHPSPDDYDDDIPF